MMSQNLVKMTIEKVDLGATQVLNLQGFVQRLIQMEACPSAANLGYFLRRGVLNP
jgi:hypothetical protein